jgi:hypothetical protein
MEETSVRDISVPIGFPRNSASSLEILLGFLKTEGSLPIGFEFTTLSLFIK